MGYGMMFGVTYKRISSLKANQKVGYVDVGTSVISEFYTPLVPKGYDFLGKLKLSNSRQVHPGDGEAEVAGVDWSCWLVWQ